jgi:hypothetical protein
METGVGYIVMLHVPGDNPDDDNQLNDILTNLDREASTPGSIMGGSKVVGLYWIPNKDEVTCRQCDYVNEKKKNGFSQHPEFGYYTHSCGRPTPGWRTNIGSRMVQALGFNLLEDADTPVIFRDHNQTYRLDHQRRKG